MWSMSDDIGPSVMSNGYTGDQLSLIRIGDTSVLKQERLGSRKTFSICVDEELATQNAQKWADVSLISIVARFLHADNNWVI